ncbi:tRNA lysidine(34) synthetase TilS [Rhabdobacter roseus]|uniref:tRNA(Ile)-lysidine synthase n=1 Tax=Rhabdobacter roseus TaxID=1655419 RepID=A0A840TQH8_9BACT|nr:tRNA lysidine(34) synthetase TilS [Rhabdobacter roseus]MBB5283967.1 tRNA(Ile)-lysidine synthase [Rhabdobacter roseus]
MLQPGMLDAFLTFINENQLPLSGTKTLLAVSGGVDSVVLVDLFQQAGFRFGIAHGNFGLRGAESDGDEQLVRQLAERLKVPFHGTQFATQQKADAERISIQMAARELRYAWFEEVRQQHAYDYLATAHHANDNLETALLNLSRGTGLAGFRGIAVQKGPLIRPLLFASKEQILDYARARQLPWREDSSNASTYYRRNLIRQEVIPILKQINPSLESTHRLTTSRLAAADALLAEYLRPWQAQALRHQQSTTYISIAMLESNSEPAYRLAWLLEPYGFTYQQALWIAAALSGQSGKRFVSPTHVLTKDRTELIVVPRTEPPPATEVVLEQPEGTLSTPWGRVQLRTLPATAFFHSGAAPTTAFFDADALVFPLKIRPWQTGDSFEPFGMAGKRKKVSDLLINAKVPLPEKEKIKVLLDATGRIAWVLGLRTDHRFRVTPHSRAILSISVHA